MPNETDADQSVIMPAAQFDRMMAALDNATTITANLAFHIEAQAQLIAAPRIFEIERHAAVRILEAERGRESFEQHWRAVEDELRTRIDRLTGYRDRLQVQVNAVEQLRLSLPADSPLRRLIADALNPPKAEVKRV